MRESRLLNALMVVSLLLTSFLIAASPSVAAGPRPTVREADRVVTTRPLRRIPPIPPRVYEVRQIERKMLPNRLGSVGQPGPDPVLQETNPGLSVPTTAVNFEGVGNRNGVLPPDTEGDVGPNHYVQMINLSFAIYDKAGNLLYGPANNNTLWSELGGPCATTNDGDPIVLYDQLADRWLMSQFALPSYPSGPFYQCIAVSQTPDPTGAWYLYQFMVSNTKLNDYPKFGVWPDGYYMSMNQFRCNIFGCSWAGAGVAAFERNKMLAGDPTARVVLFDLYSRDPNLGGMLPADWDGTVQPPAGAPNYFVQIDDDSWGYTTQDQLQVWQFAVDWTNPSSSTFTFARSLATAPFDANMCGYARNCIPQPGGTNVDAISDRVMFRLQYRNLGDHQAMVVNHTVDVDGTNHAGIRWYELRNSGSAWSLYQQGTFAPDSDHRWMGSVAMNGAGDIALGYSVSSSTTYPSIRFTGRFDGDTTGLMTQGEGVIAAGSGYQRHSSGRWGDYSAMSVDPVDDCTFWYTQEYYTTTGLTPNWQTRVGAFRLRSCGPVDSPPAVTITDPDESQSIAGDYRVLVGASDDSALSQVALSIDGGDYIDITDYYDGTHYFYDWDTKAYGDGSHTLRAQATDDALQSTESVPVNVTVDNLPPAPTHVGDLDGTRTNVRNKWTADVTITVHDADEGLVSGATVSGTWSEGATGSAQCTTDGGGTCTVTLTGISAKVATVTFTVDNVSHVDYVYDSSANHDEDGDSTGTSIIVPPPVKEPPVAQFTYSCSDRTCTFDASTSYDPDGGSLSAYYWDFGDGSTGSGVVVERTYADYDTYQVSLMVTDDEADTGNTSQAVTVSEPGGSMHIGDLDGAGTAAQRGRWDVTVTILVHDGFEKPLTNATVTGIWSNGATGGTSCVTDGNGLCSVTKNNLKSNVDSVTWTVDTVTHPSNVYDGANHDPDGDSNGTTIIIIQP